MDVITEKENPSQQIKPGLKRRIAYLDNILVAVIDFEEGPMAEPDPPHSHVHEQITYVAEGELWFFIEDRKYRLQKGDIFKVPSHKPHTVQTISEHVRLIDSFTPVREDFIKSGL